MRVIAVVINSGLRSLFFFLFICTASLNLSAMDLPNPPQSDPALVGWNGVMASALSRPDSSSKLSIEHHQRLFMLSDGTVVPAIVWSGAKGPNGPVILVNMGIFTACSFAPSQLVESLVGADPEGADLVIIDSVTSADFFMRNKEVGLGGYDEGRILVELATILRGERSADSPIYLFGVSLGGNAVVQALIEAQRQGLDIFHSGLIFSALLDQAQSTQAIFTAVGKPLIGIDSAKLSSGGNLVFEELLKYFLKDLEFDGLTFDDPHKEAAEFFSSQFDRRLERLRGRERLLGDWNPAVSVDSLEEYVETSSLLLHGIQNLRTPLIVIHAKNDPVIPYKQFREFASEAHDNPFVLTHGTSFGGHWGFFGTYGIDWVQDLIHRMEQI